jgi:cellulose synthase/poly-beta-1,6-N-acetylglucosamine synthase-like glycosyltransferase
MQLVLACGRYRDCPRSEPPLAAEGNFNPKCAQEGLCPAQPASQCARALWPAPSAGAGLQEVGTLEIIIVDDRSTDDSPAIATELAAQHSMIRLLRHEKNTGKGAAIRSGISEASGDFVAIQDADLEYDPKDLVRLIEPLAAGKADVVIGSRFLSSGSHRVLYFWHSIGNKFLTLLSNMLTDLNLTDIEVDFSDV